MNKAELSRDLKAVFAKHGVEIWIVGVCKDKADSKEGGNHEFLLNVDKIHEKDFLLGLVSLWGFPETPGAAGPMFG